MSIREIAKRLLSPEDFEVAEDAVGFLKSMPGPWNVEDRELMEHLTWFLKVDGSDLMALKGADLGIGEDAFASLVFGAMDARKSEFCSTERHLMGLMDERGLYRVAVSCHYLARLKWSRVHDRKKMRRKLWGEAKYCLLPFVDLLSEPHRTWLLNQYAVEMAADAKKGQTFKRGRANPKPPGLKIV
jgi:hypothetical protein